MIRRTTTRALLGAALILSLTTLSSCTLVEGVKSFEASITGGSCAVALVK